MAEARYGTTVEDVQDLMPHVVFTDDRPPLRITVERLLERASGWVAVRVGRGLTLAVIPDQERLSAALTHAKTATALRAAGWLETVDRPEDPQAGARLLAQADATLDELLAALGVEEGDVGVGGFLGGPQPVGSFPDPLFSPYWDW